MRLKLAALLLLATAAFGATVKLYLKDGDYQLAREYQVLADRVRYYSTERSDWEEIPLELVDLDRTRKEASAREAAIQTDVKAQAEEDAAIRAERRRVANIPTEPGVYLIDGDNLRPLKAAESKLVNNKKRSVLKVLSPIPIVPGKSTVELEGEHAEFLAPGPRPEFYFRLSAEQSFGLAKLGAKKGARVVETVNFMPVTKEAMEEREMIPTFKKQEADQLFKIWPEKPLEPGEYALLEFTDGSVNMQVWDFRVGK